VSSLLAALRGVTASFEDDPLRWIRWTPPQDAIHRLQAKRKLFRAGNQLGKSWSALAEVIWRATGTHPHYETKAPPIEAWVVCTSWSQAVAIMGKFHFLCPAGMVDVAASSRYTSRNGYGKDNPACVFKNGSVVRFKTTKQGPTALQGATLDYVLIDEPTTPEIYRELDRRLTRTGGSLCLSLTPVNIDCSWIEQAVEEGVISEVHALLTAENLTPVPRPTDTFTPEPFREEDGTLMDADWIKDQWRKVPSAFAPVVLDGEWNIRPEGVFFDIFDPRVHVSSEVRLDAQRGQVRWCLGIDYAAANRDHGQVAVLTQVQQIKDDKGRSEEVIFVRDCVVVSGVMTNKQFARLILDMLDAHGIVWSDIDEVYGDNPVQSRYGYRSNIETGKALARHMGIGYRALQPRLKNVKDGAAAAGMVMAGCRYLYERLAEGRFMVHPRALPVIEAMQTWDLDTRHPAKDRIDAVRYALKGYIFARHRGPRAVLRAG